MPVPPIKFRLNQDKIGLEVLSMPGDGVLLFIGAHPDDESFGPGATLAHYALMGVKVYYACATRGEAGTIDPQFFMSGLADSGDVRWAELQCAGRVLGLSAIFHLGYRDSGMAGSADNRHPQALVNAPVEQVAGRIVRIIREIKPQVILTHDPCGDYGHPDHVAVNRAAVEAFRAAGDGGRYPEAGAPFQPSKLYYSVFPRRLLKLAVRLLPLLGQNPKKFGRNKDIDLTRLTGECLPVHARVKLSRAELKARGDASACHCSQLYGGGGPPRAGLLGLIEKLIGRRDSFSRAFPPAVTGTVERDLFEGLDQDSKAR
ncbi:GlcNAc-PI de-N-acetylase [Dehalogenimonas alkenigignens]|uniref:GlcNAc-PI de-N-acetylase n=2 Tax=Dehalogenimonas alkenigignens TaxID=1217799 RepID=A0A0W0GKG4_9CHLR|nr:GlcNAc-PI de-N-acetylase [Dehalogenimonas alkenigignens]